MNVIKINKDFNRLSLDTNTKNENIGIDHLEKIYTFSKTGKNVIVIDLDMGISGYIPYIFEEKPELLNSFSGFTYYPNTISFGRVTIFGSPGIFGGYEYAPLEMKKRNTESYLRKLEESILMLPRIFSNRGYRTTLNDLQFAIDSAFAEYPEITVKKTHGKYLDYYYSQHNDLKVSDSVIKIKSNLIRFNFFKFSPLILRSFVYDGGEYLTYGTTYSLPAYTLDWYSQLYFLPEISTFQDKPENTFSILINEITHQPVAFFETPDYTPVSIVSNRGNGPFANEDFYHVNMAALLLLGKWFDFLKENDVYDNTRIIIVSDHGTNLHSAFPGNIILPDKRPLQWYQPILLVKDFNQKHSLLTDDTFMTNADVPVLATDGLISNPVNPFTGNAITAEKENGVTITTAIQLKAMKNLQKNHGSVKKDEWMHVHDNIFDINNWKQVEVTE
ncbi:hypothetical protein AGMMS50212_05440 [Spirochaetia bacterium]|nr:hypothetical protein AGMMS50212_05440 [Spirochaetia bacterium]